MFKRAGQGMAGKLILMMSAVVVLVFCAAFLLVNLFTTDLSLEKERQAMHAYLQSSISLLDDRLKDLGRATTLAVADSGAQEILLGWDGYSYRQKLEASDYLQKLFLSMLTSRNDISGIFLFNNERLVSKYSLYTISVRTSFTLAGNEWFQGNLKGAPVLSNGTQLMTGSLKSFLITPVLPNAFENEYLTVLRALNSFSPYERIGYMMVTTRMSALDSILTKAIDDGASYCLVDDAGAVLLESTGKHFYKQLADVRPELTGLTLGELGAVSIGGERCAVLSERSGFSNLTLMIVKPEAQVYRDARRTLWLVLSIFTAAALLVLGISALMIRRTLRPITSLASQMESFSRTNTRLSAEPGAKDEAKRLGDAFNGMMDTINELIFLEYEKTIQLQQTKLREQRTQLMYLQSQIDPHFLYNTLDTIRIKASINGDQEVAALIMKLVAFFRFGVGDAQALAPIRHEVKLMQVYLQLMQCRYPQLKDEYALDDSLMGVMVPRFILQPLVENSLTHGLKSIGFEGQIGLSVFSDPEDEDAVLIELRDNGTGMSDSQMERLNKREFAPESDAEPQRSIGVRNVQERLQISYGPGYGLHYARNAGGGVTVTIRVTKDEPKNT